MSRNLIEQKALEGKIKGLFLQDIRNLITNFRDLSSQIKKFAGSKEQRDKLFDQLEISFSISYNSKRETLSPPDKQKLLLDFFEEFANIRHNCHNVLQSSRVLQLAELIPQIDPKELTAQEIQDLAKNFDLIGFNCATIFSKPETANIFLENGLGKLTSAKYHGSKWIKNSIHFLVHCKNLGLLGARNSQETKDLVISIINEISQFIVENSENLNFNASDAQASLDILLYGKHVIGLPIDELTESKVAAINYSFARRNLASKTQLEIFQRIVNFLENRKGGDDEWKHSAQDDQLAGEEFIFGGVVAIGIEKPFISIDRIEEKTADIIVRNLVTGEIILAIEIDGPTHFLYDEIKSGKTLARDELARATLGERFLVINMKSFNLFRNLSQEAKKSFEELEFLTKIQSIIQKELDKIPAAPQEVSTQDLSKKPEEFPKTLELEKKELAAPKAIKLKPRAKTAKEIEEQQARILDLFWKTLNQNLDGDSIDLIQEILSDPLFESIPRERIVNLNLNPFDFVLTKFNSLQLQEEKTRATILLNLLWINGFNHEDESALDKTLEYPVELNSALGREKVLREKSIDLDAILKNAQRNNFRLVGAALRRDAFPQAISDEEKEKIIKLTEIAILQSCAGHDYLLSRLQTQPWFRGVEEEIFIQTLENSNDSIAQFLLERKKGNPEFFIDFFSTHENLLSKIYNFALSSTTDKLEEEIKKDASLNAKIVQEVTQSSEFHHARDLSKLVEMLLLESNQNAKALIFKASLQFQRLLSTKPSPEKHAAINQVRILLERALSYERNDDESIERAKLLLANVYNYLKDSEKAKEILIPISSSSGDACYQLSMMGFSKDDSLAFLKKAAELFHPKATGIIAVQLLEAESDIEAKSDIKEAIKMLKKAVELGDLDSIANLGTTYINNCEIHGLTIEESCKKGFELFKESTLRGSCIGAFNLANCYKNGWGVSKNIEQSLETYKLFIKICAQDKAEDRIDREDGDENEYKSENEIEIENLVSIAEREIALLESQLNPKKLISGAQAQTVVDAREAGQSVND